MQSLTKIFLNLKLKARQSSYQKNNQENETSRISTKIKTHP